VYCLVHRQLISPSSPIVVHHAITIAIVRRAVAVAHNDVVVHLCHCRRRRRPPSLSSSIRVIAVTVAVAVIVHP